MELELILGRIIPYDKEAPLPEKEGFLRIDGKIYRMSHITSVPPILESLVQPFVTVKYKEKLTEITPMCGGPPGITVTCYPKE
jgi:hypothetical protein